MLKTLLEIIIHTNRLIEILLYNLISTKEEKRREITIDLITGLTIELTNRNYGV